MQTLSAMRVRSAQPRHTTLPITPLPYGCPRSRTHATHLPPSQRRLLYTTHLPPSQHRL